MPLDLGELSTLDPKISKTIAKKKKRRVTKKRKASRGSWKRLGEWWICRKCGKEVSTRTQSPIPKMICKECQKNADTGK